MFRDKFKEECGVFGVFSNFDDFDATGLTYCGLYALQHRGQESAGIASCSQGNLSIKKGMGLVGEVFNQEILGQLKGNAAIGHVRYSTTGASSIINAQPLLSELKFGKLAIAHNGNLINTSTIKEDLENSGSIFYTTTDSEIILNLIAKKTEKDIESAIKEVVQEIKGAYSFVVLTENSLIGVRDPAGIRPLCLGKIGENYILCSESCALSMINAQFVRDIMPGEMVVIDKNGVCSTLLCEQVNYNICAFEYIYFARPDSVIDGVNVYEAREKAGELLFKESPVEADIVVGVPDSGIPAAMGYAHASGIPLKMGLIKNKYIGRTFIAPNQKDREKMVSIKMNSLSSIVKGKKIVLIDDSIVRGTTSRKLIEILRKSGAKEIHFRISSPKVKFSCDLGMDTSSYEKEIIGNYLKTEEINKILGSDSLKYLSMEGMLETLKSKEKKGFCLGCFTGQYPY